MPVVVAELQPCKRREGAQVQLLRRVAQVIISIVIVIIVVVIVMIFIVIIIVVLEGGMWRGINDQLPASECLG